MKKLCTHRSTALRFRRWSRRAYAAFVSVQHTVTIGQLSANVANRFQTKNRSLHSSASLKESQEEETAPTTDLLPDGARQLGLTVILQWFEAVVVPSLQTVETAAHLFLLKITRFQPQGGKLSSNEESFPPCLFFTLYIYDLH